MVDNGNLRNSREEELGSINLVLQVQNRAFLDSTFARRVYCVGPVYLFVAGGLGGGRYLTRVSCVGHL